MTEKKIVKIYYEGWGMDCCGDPIHIGDLLTDFDVGILHEGFSKPATKFGADYYYDNHGNIGIPNEEQRTIEANVLSIQEYWQELREEKAVFVSTGLTLLRDVTVADRFPKSPGKSWRLNGFLIEVELLDEQPLEE